VVRYLLDDGVTCFEVYGSEHVISSMGKLRVPCRHWTLFLADPAPDFKMLDLKAAAAAEVHRAACSAQGNEGAHRVHSGYPAFRRPSINS